MIRVVCWLFGIRVLMRVVMVETVAGYDGGYGGGDRTQERRRRRELFNV